MGKGIRAVTFVTLLILAGCAVPQPMPGAGEALQMACDGPGCINVYFNKSVMTGYATAGNAADGDVNLETRLISRINTATTTIDVATYELNLPDIVQALIDRAAAGVRVIADAKRPTDAEHVGRYELMRVYLERLARGRDATVGTADDVRLFADAPIFAVEDATLRAQHALPATPTDFPHVTVQVGSAVVSGYRIADGERKTTRDYYSERPQMHNKFVVIDGAWVWTGSWNFTVTGLYGSEENRQAGILGGNQQHAVEIHSTDLAAAYKIEFDEMWGGTSSEPNPDQANFHGRKADNTPHVFDIGGRTVELYFSPGDDAIGHVTSYVRDQADHSAYFTIFAWSDQGLVDELKVKWEGSKEDQAGERTGFDVRGVFDSSFWNQWWSASIDMTGRAASRSGWDGAGGFRWVHWCD